MRSNQESIHLTLDDVRYKGAKNANLGFDNVADWDDASMHEAINDPSKNPDIVAVAQHEKFVNDTAREASTVAMLEMESAIRSKLREKRFILELSTVMATLIGLYLSSGDVPLTLATVIGAFATDLAIRYGEFKTPFKEAFAKTAFKAFTIATIIIAVRTQNEMLPVKPTAKIMSPAGTPALVTGIPPATVESEKMNQASLEELGIMPPAK